MPVLLFFDCRQSTIIPLFLFGFSRRVFLSVCFDTLFFLTSGLGGLVGGLSSSWPASREQRQLEPTQVGHAAVKVSLIPGVSESLDPFSPLWRVKPRQVSCVLLFS